MEKRSKSQTAGVKKIKTNNNSKKLIKVEKFSIGAILQFGLLLVYIAGCLIILLPQIDYQSWYPEALGVHDYNLSMQFKSHKIAVVDVSGQDNGNIQRFIEVVNKRMQIAGIPESIIKLQDDKLEIHFPDNYSEDYIRNFLSVGEIQFMKMKEQETSTEDITLSEEETQADSENNDSQDVSNTTEIQTEVQPPEILDPYDIKSYDKTDISQDKITDARITSSDESYIEIQITTDRKQREVWNKVYEESLLSGFAMFVDGQTVSTYIMASDKQSAQPQIVIMQQENADILVAKIGSHKLPFSPEVEIKQSNIEIPQKAIYLLIAILGIVLLFGLIVSYFYVQKSFIDITKDILTIIGILTLIKFFPIIISIQVIIVIMLLILMKLILTEKPYNQIMAFILAISLILLAFTPIGILNIVQTILAFSIISLIYFLVFYFSGLSNNE
ncbi:hypothetical protein JW887_01780 [Candidatus Dojkabacteria bacterium]|nr:hypothetical protein [Candidatus Dojkabacteria bacterium]